jgi:urease accessory protein UreH
MSVHSSLYLEGSDTGLYVSRSGVLNALLVEKNSVIIANPSEVLAHDDSFEINITLKGNFQVTDQAYTKILSDSHVKLKYSITSSGSLSFLPKPILIYDDSYSEMVYEFHIDGSARIIETCALGRSGHGEIFQTGKVRSITKIYSRQKLIATDVLLIEDASWKNSNVMGRNCLLTRYDVNNETVDVEKKLFDLSDLDAIIKNPYCRIK